jgi:hypothetical protein
VVGDFSLRRVQARTLQPAPSHLAVAARAEDYPRNAVSTLAPRGGSSVEGEQPKFLARLPMLWAPVAGNATPRPVFAPAPPLPAEIECWRPAAAWAEDFWQRVATAPRVSPEFALISHEAGETVCRLRAHFAAR